MLESVPAASFSPRPRTGATKLLLFGVAQQKDMLAKGNVWYVQNYESAFDEVCVAYLIGGGEEIRRGRSRLIPLGSSKGAIVDILFSPIRLYQLARRERPTLFLTADQWFSWWTASLSRYLLGASVVLMPVCIPEQMYKDHRKTVSGLPLWADRWLRRLSFRSSSYVYTAHAFGSFVDWLSRDPWSAGKLITGDGLVEALPSAEFMASAAAVGLESRDDGLFRAVYVGRLSDEKLVDHLLRSFQLLSNEYRLVLVGDGPARSSLESLANSLKISERVEFRGEISNGDLPKVLRECNAFVSTLTGTSLREAALMGLPIVAYDRDWLHGLLENDKHALLVDDADIAGLARQVERLGRNPDLARRLGQNAQTLASSLWTLPAARQSLEKLCRMAEVPRRA